MSNRYAKSHRFVAETNYPDVFITKNKNRLKVYRGSELYMNSGDEFQLEFDNRTRTTWLAKIKLNGEWATDSGLVLRPGEHVFLDTPNLDSSNKRRFRFETYEILKGRSYLVEDNGLVEIFFYKKQQNMPVWISYTPSVHHYHHHYNKWNNWDYGYSGGFVHTTSTHKPTFRNDGSSVNIMSNATLTSNNSGGGLYDQGKFGYSNEKEETGRIEQGSISNQDFVNSNEEFESWSSYEMTYKILPYSKKHTTVQEVKEYCSDCGRRRRKNENFCPSCGEKF